jgi:hypothetical protein
MVTMMKKYLFLITAVLIFFSACNDPVFYSISLEEKILEPRIKGSPTNFIEFNGKMFVASGEFIYKYEKSGDGKGGWEHLKGVGESIISLAVAYDHIYALCVESEKRKLKLSADGTNWEIVPNSSLHNIMSIYSAGNQLFIGASNPSGDRSKYYILYGGNLSTILVETGNSLLNGAVYNAGDYYLCVKDLKDSSGGIYSTNNLTNEYSAVLIKGNIPFMGIMNTEIGYNPVVAISRNGDLYTVNKTSVDKIVSLGNSHLATGALCVWESDDGYKLLLAGRQDILKSSINSGYTFGYLELDLTDDGISGAFSEPGKKSITTLNLTDKNERYQSTIGKIPINALYQSPQHIDSEKTFFASTQKNGLWSYRNRKGMWHWNAEE